MIKICSSTIQLQSDIGVTYGGRLINARATDTDAPAASDLFEERRENHEEEAGDGDD